MLKNKSSKIETKIKTTQVIVYFRYRVAEFQSVLSKKLRSMRKRLQKIKIYSVLYNFFITNIW